MRAVILNLDPLQGAPHYRDSTRRHTIRIVVTLSAACSLLLAATHAPAASRWGADYFPNTELITHEGRRVRFFDDLLKDKVVAINFIFTRCMRVCPAETAKMRQVQRLLGDRVGRDVFLYSISIDPEHDTPEVLERYAKTFDVGPGWLFLTGARDDITALQKKLGVFIEEISDDPEDHNISLIVGNQKTGRWMKRSPHDSPRVLAQLLGEALHNYASAARSARASYTGVSAPSRFSRGEYLFQARCSSCHTIGGGSTNVGPDLAGVTSRRDRRWLKRWIAAPDEMLADGDPLAMELYARYGELAMPNFGLSATDVDAILEFLDRQSENASAAPSRDDAQGARQ